MGSITAVRASKQVAANPGPQLRDSFHRQAVAGNATPVTEPQRTDAVAQTDSTAALVAARLAERDESRHPAAEARIAAEAARKAYIKASIAAGVNPLPLP